MGDTQTEDEARVALSPPPLPPPALVGTALGDIAGSNIAEFPPTPPLTALPAMAEVHRLGSGKNVIGGNKRSGEVETAVDGSTEVCLSQDRCTPVSPSHPRPLSGGKYDYVKESLALLASTSPSLVPTQAQYDFVCEILFT